MSLELITARGRTSLDDLEGHLLALFDRFGLSAPEFRKVHDALYSDPTLGPAQVVQLRLEFCQLRDHYKRSRMEALKRERKVFAKDKAMELQILEGLLAGDEMLEKIDQVLALCDDAIRVGDSIVCGSD